MAKKGRSVGRFISILYRQAQSYIAAQLKPYNIGSGQYVFLVVLLERDGISQEELSNRVMIDKGTTARAIDKLEQAGYVFRRTNPDDRRENIVQITDKTREIAPVLQRTLMSWTEILVSGLGEEERETLYSNLEKMIDNAKTYVSGEDTP